MGFRRPCIKPWRKSCAGVGISIWFCRGLGSNQKLYPGRYPRRLLWSRRAFRSCPSTMRQQGVGRLHSWLARRRNRASLAWRRARLYKRGRQRGRMQYLPLLGSTASNDRGRETSRACFHPRERPSKASTESTGSPGWQCATRGRALGHRKSRGPSMIWGLRVLSRIRRVRSVIMPAEPSGASSQFHPVRCATS